MISDRMIRSNYLIPRDLYASVKITAAVGRDIKNMRRAGLRVALIAQTIEALGGPHLSKPAIYKFLRGTTQKETRTGRYRPEYHQNSVARKRTLFFRRKLLRKIPLRMQHAVGASLVPQDE